MEQTPLFRTPSSRYVATRFALRILLLGLFAALSGQGFEKAFESFLFLAIVYCVFAVAVRREMPFGPVLTHLDEAAGYLAVFCAVCAFL